MSEDHSRLAERVQTLRKRKGWSVTETARRAGVSTSMLWKVENGQTSLTYQKLMKLASALEVPIGELFAVEAAGLAPGGRRVIDRSGAAPVVDFGGNLHHFLATDIAQKHYFPILVEVRASTRDSQDLEAHGGEEFAYVIEGAIEFRCEGYAPARLEAGDSVYFDASLKHHYVCAAGEVAKMVCVYSSAEALGGMRSITDAAGHSRAMQLFKKASAESRTTAPAERSIASRPRRRRS